MIVVSSNSVQPKFRNLTLIFKTVDPLVAKPAIIQIFVSPLEVSCSNRPLLLKSIERGILRSVDGKSFDTELVIDSLHPHLGQGRS